MWFRCPCHSFVNARQINEQRAKSPCKGVWGVCTEPKETQIDFPYITLCVMLYVLVEISPFFSSLLLLYVLFRASTSHPLLSEIAPIHWQWNSRDPRGVIAGQKDGAFGHIGHVAPLPPRSRGDHVRADRWIFVIYLCHGGFGDCERC